MLNYTGTKKEGVDQLSHLVAQNPIMRIGHGFAFQRACHFHEMILFWSHRERSQPEPAPTGLLLSHRLDLCADFTPFRINIERFGTREGGRIDHPLFPWKGGVGISQGQ